MKRQKEEYDKEMEGPMPVIFLILAIIIILLTVLC